jgi:hypothetical protein
MTKLWQRIEESWRRRSDELDANAVENAQLSHAQAELEKHRETSLEPGRSNTDWTYVPPA